MAQSEPLVMIADFIIELKICIYKNNNFLSLISKLYYKIKASYKNSLAKNLGIHLLFLYFILSLYF